MGEVSKAAEDVKSDIERDYKALRAEVTKLSDRLVSLTSTDHPSIKSRARAGARKMQRKLEDEYEMLHDKASDAMESADDMISERPFAALGVAAGVGLLVGLLVSRRR